MKRTLLRTNDGSMTIHLPELNEQYHSKHGALQEAQHVFIKKGLIHQTSSTHKVNILEIGFGTGLNALLTLAHGITHKKNIRYTGVEAFPINDEEHKAMNYGSLLKNPIFSYYYNALHQSPWEQPIAITTNFILTKEQKTFDQISDKNAYDLIYFDAFGPRVQPELWEKNILEIMYTALKQGGVLVTYCAKGSVRRTLIEVGFTVERLDGPPGKREMIRATKC